ncbi:MAG: hypothetical protein ACK58T_45200, partial [Phycisphaerae bacterium]
HLQKLLRFDTDAESLSAGRCAFKAVPAGALKVIIQSRGTDEAEVMNRVDGCGRSGVFSCRSPFSCSSRLTDCV